MWSQDSVAERRLEIGMDKKYPTIDKIETGKRIHFFMQKLGLSVAEVQNYMGFSTQQAVYHWIHGRSLPTIDNIYALSELFGVPMDAIICGNRKFQSESDRLKCRLMMYIQSVEKLAS